MVSDPELTATLTDHLSLIRCLMDARLFPWYSCFVLFHLRLDGKLITSRGQPHLQSQFCTKESHFRLATRSQSLEMTGDELHGGAERGPVDRDINVRTYMYSLDILATRSGRSS